MKQLFIALTLVATPLLAQPASTMSDGKKPVAIFDGETITADKLSQMYDRLPADMRAQYDKNGGKGALLDNYIRKRLVIRHAQKSGFDKRPDVQADIEAAKESALFDRYVRDVVTRTILTPVAMKQYYEQHLAQFAVPEMVKVRHVVIGVNSSGPHPHTEPEAMELAKKVLTDVLLSIPRTDNPAATAQEHSRKFAALARQYSEDAAGPSGGDLGWVAKGQLDPDFEAVAFSIRTGIPSGIIKTRFGYHVIFVEGKRAAGTMSFDEAKPHIRDRMLAEHATEIVSAVNQLTDDLSDKSKIAVYPENIR